MDRDDWRMIITLLDDAAKAAHDVEQEHKRQGDADGAHDAGFLKNRYRRLSEAARVEMGKVR